MTCLRQLCFLQVHFSKIDIVLLQVVIVLSLLIRTCLFLNSFYGLLNSYSTLFNFENLLDWLRLISFSKNKKSSKKAVTRIEEGDAP